MKKAKLYKINKWMKKNQTRELRTNEQVLWMNKWMKGQVTKEWTSTRKYIKWHWLHWFSLDLG